MIRHWHPTLERIVRWLKPSAESFAAAAAVYGPDLMLQLKAKPGAVEGPRSPERDGRSRETRPRRHGAVPALRPVTRCTLVTGRLLSVKRRPLGSDRIGWQDGSNGDLEGAQECRAR